MLCSLSNLVGTFLKEEDTKEQSKYSACNDDETGNSFIFDGQPVSCSASPEVEEEVEEDGEVDAAAFLTDKAKYETKESCVDSLDNVHVEDAKEYSLNYVGCPEWESLLCDT